MNFIQYDKLNLWDDNEPLEEAMLKSCLIFNRRANKNNRDSLFEKYILSLIIAEEAETTDEIEQIVNQHYGNGFVDKVQINKALSGLAKKKIISPKEEGKWSPSDKSGAQYIVDLNQRIDNLIDEIYRITRDSCSKCNLHISNKEAVVKRNIKNCLSYYFTVSGYSFFSCEGQKVDIGHKFEELKSIEDMAEQGLSKNISLHVINSIGQFIKEHSKEYDLTLQELGSAYITAQVIGIDPLLNNFKQKKISDKVFIVDTDVVLNYITDHGRYSTEYKKMIDQLLTCGCQLYIPQQVIGEVYKHGEAARKRYGYYGTAIESNSIDARDVSDNVFLEDYAYDINNETRKHISWSVYLGNIYNPKIGESYTADVIRNKFKENVICGSLPDGTSVDDQLLQQMHDSALERTQNTQKGIHRKDEENEDVTTTDLTLFLSVRSLNMNVNNSSSKNQRQEVLTHKYYLLSSAARIQACAAENGIEDKIICNPKALISYLSEAGLMKKEDKTIINLFDNNFLIHVAREIKDTVSEFIKVGLNLKGQNLVCMRYSLEEETHQFLTFQSPDDYKRYYEQVTAKGYEFAPYAQEVLKENKEKSEEIDRLKEYIKRLEDEKRIMQEEEVRQKKKKRKELYENRVNKGKLHKKNKSKQ